MKRISLASTILILIIVLGMNGCDSLSAPSLERASSNSTQNTGIWVIGEGKVTVVPDMAVLILGVEAVADTVADAYNDAIHSLASIGEAIGHIVDLETGTFSISQLTRYDSDKGTQIITGYRVTNTVTAEIRHELIESTTLDYKVSEIIDTAAKAGGDYVRINGLSFTVEDPSVYYDEAREKAAADAKAKAEKLAEEFGLKLEDPTYISESIYAPYYDGIDSTGFSTGSGSILPPISIGDTDITINLQVAYSIE
jgi:uncharacterized protein YggE